MPKMLILRGNRGKYADESGNVRNYEKGALHEGAAKEYARRKGFEGVVLDVSGDAPADGKRLHSPQTIEALDAFLRDDTITAFYGFSGGGFNIYWILQRLKKAKNEDALKRIKLITVLGAPERKQSEFESSGYKPGNWELVYLTNPPSSAKVAPKGVSTHMFGPEWLLLQTPDPNSQKP